MKRRILTILMACAVVGTITPTISAASIDNNEKGYISISYTTEKEVSPDTVEFSVSVKTTDKQSMKVASDKNKEISNKIYDYLKSNINTSNGDYIKTSNYSANPIYIYKDNKRIFDKYEVSNNITIHTKSLDKVSTYIDNSIKLGATGVNSLNFTLSNKDSQCNDILADAGKQLRKRADIVAASVGSNVTGLRHMNASCSLNQRSVNYAYSNRVMLKAAMADGATEQAMPSTSIESGNITIYANTDASFFVK